MGYSISQETHERIEENRRLGRLCQGSSRCSVRATKLVRQRSWTYVIGQGPESNDPMVMCAAHARQTPVGTQGVNFIVTGIENLPRLRRGDSPQDGDL